MRLLSTLKFQCMAGAILAAGVANAVPVVQNGTFETPTSTTSYGPIDNWAQAPNPSGLSGFTYLSGEDAAGGNFWNNGYVPGAGAAGISGKVGAIQVYANVATLSLTQTVSGFDPGTLYQLTYYENARAGTSTPLIQVLVGGVPVVASHLDTPVAANGDFTVPFRSEVSIPFTTTGTSAVVEIRVNQVTSGDDASATFDDVAISQLPEPASLGLLALASVGLLQRRRRV